MKKQAILKFTRNLALFILLFFVCDAIIGYGLKKLYFSLKTGQFGQNTYAIDVAKPDILVFGSSRALHHYSSAIIGDSLHQSIYNMGRDGQFLPYYCAIEDVVLKRKVPKIIIMDVNVWELGPNESKYIKLASLLPYVADHPELKKYTSQISDFENWKLMSKTYPYNSTLLISVYDHIFSDKIPQDDRGYFPLVRTVGKKEFENYAELKKLYNIKRAKQNIKIDHKAIEYYRQFLQKTTDLNIKTFVVISPTILEEPETEEKHLLATIAKEFKNVTFLDYSKNPDYMNQYQLFADEFHLNNIGAEKFSKDIVSRIKGY